MAENKALTIDEYRVFLRQNGLKVTPQRLAVHEAMLALGHACADMVTDYIMRSGETSVTVASVYNILSQLSQLGMYSRRLSSNNKMYFDVNTFRHMHLYDTVNNEYKDVLDEELIRTLEDRLSKRRFKGYKIDGVDIQILCHPARRAKASSR